MGNFWDLGFHKWRRPLEEIAQRLNSIIGGMIIYFHKLGGEDHSGSVGSTQPSTPQMGEVGQGIVQNGGCQMVKATVQSKAGPIRTLEII